MRKNLVALCAIAFLLLFAILVLADPHAAAVLLREGKARVDVFFIYGSTPGKLLYLPLLLAISLPLMNYGRLLWRHPKARGIAFFVLGALSVSLWFLGFHEVGNALRKNHVNPYQQGTHIQFCDEGNFYTEYVGYEHVHSLKEVASKLVIGPRNFHTGEDFWKLHDFSVAVPAFLLGLTLLLYFVALPAYREFPAGTSIVHVVGFYILFFSFFDGGVFVGIHGLLLLLYPLLRDGTRWYFSRELKSIYLFLGSRVAALSFYFLFLRLDGYPMEAWSGWPLVSYYFVGQSIRHAIVLLFFNAITGLSRSKFFSLVFLVGFFSLYVTQHNVWWLGDAYSDPVRKGEQVTLLLYSERPPPVGEILVRAKNISLVTFRNEEETTAWELCWKTLNQMEGVTYQSLMVTVYCRSLSPIPVSNRQIFLPLEKGSCGFTCNPKLQTLYPITPASNGAMLLEGIRGMRGEGVIFCLTDSTKEVSRLRRPDDP